MIRPDAAACSRGASVTAEVTRQAAARERSPDDAIPGRPSTQIKQTGYSPTRPSCGKPSPRLVRRLILIVSGPREQAPGGKHHDRPRAAGPARRRPCRLRDHHSRRRWSFPGSFCLLGYHLPGPGAACSSSDSPSPQRPCPASQDGRRAGARGQAAPGPPNQHGRRGEAARLFDVRGAGSSVADSCCCWYLCAGPALRQDLVGAVGGSLAAALAPAAGGQARSLGGQGRAWLAAQGACWPGE